MIKYFISASIHFSVTHMNYNLVRLTWDSRLQREREQNEETSRASGNAAWLHAKHCWEEHWRWATWTIKPRTSQTQSSDPLSMLSSVFFLLQVDFILVDGNRNILWSRGGGIGVWKEGTVMRTLGREIGDISKRRTECWICAGDSR